MEYFGYRDTQLYNKPQFNKGNKEAISKAGSNGSRRGKKTAKIYNSKYINSLDMSNAALSE
jgi:hypothetical protein